MTMQDNGRSPNERPSLISSTPIPGTVDCAAQDRKNCRRVVPKQRELRKEPDATEKTAHLSVITRRGYQGGMNNPKPKPHGAGKSEGNAETMLYRDI